MNKDQQQLEVIRTHIESLPAVQRIEVQRIADIMRELLARNTCAALALALIGAAMSTKRENLSDPSSCLNRALGDEPIFILRASDPVAPLIVVEWAFRYLKENGGLLKMTDAQRLKYMDAFEVAADMEKYRELASHDRHVCGLQGYDPMRDPQCRGCAERGKA